MFTKHLPPTYTLNECLYKIADFFSSSFKKSITLYVLMKGLGARSNIVRVLLKNSMNTCVSPDV